MGINNRLKSLKVELDSSFTKHAEASRQEHIKELSAGAPLPKENAIYGSEHLAAFREEAEELRSQALAAIAEEREKVQKQMADAPSSEAVNAISLLKMRTDLTPDDVNTMLSAYGENYSAHKAITSIANSAGVKYDYPSHKLDKEADGLDYVASKVPSMFSATAYEKDGVQPVITLGFNTTIDSELPE